MSKPLVAIRCITYNHAPYIRKCLDSIVMQQTNFDFVVIVHDDCSTDGTTAIVHEYAERYPKIVKPIYETENQYSKRDGSVRRIVDEAVLATQSKYMAYCEGDDYWDDLNKLQKQVDFLEANPSYWMCCSAVRLFSQAQNQFVGRGGTPLCESYETSIQGANDIYTATALVHVDAWRECINEITKFLPQYLIFDTAYWYWYAYHHKVKYFDETNAVYRVLENSASHASDYEVQLQQQWRFVRLKLYFLAKYPLRENQSQVMETIMQELNQVMELSRLCGESKVRQSKTFRLGKFLKNIFRK